jgi:hypothetical protein
LYSHHKVQTPRAKRFWGELAGVEAEMDARNLEGYEEEIERIVAALPPELRFVGATPEQRLAGLTPEQRMAGLPPEQLILGLPDEILRGLSAESLSRLPAETRAAIRKRLGQA